MIAWMVVEPEISWGSLSVLYNLFSIFITCLPFFSLLPLSPLSLQWSLLLPDHCHPGVPAGLTMLTNPSHSHAGVHPSLCWGQQWPQGARFLCGHRPAAQPHQRLQPWSWTHCQSLPVSLFVCLCLCLHVLWMRSDEMSFCVCMGVTKSVNNSKIWI